VKTCPTCKRSFTDDSLSFCLEDGTPLVSVTQSTDEETLVRPPVKKDYLPAKETIRVSPFQTPGSLPYDSKVSERPVWPWIVAIVGLILLVIIAIAGVAIVGPALIRASKNENQRRPSSTPTPRVVETETPTPEPSSSPEEESDDDMPTDHEEVVSSLKKVEESWTEANIKGDKDALEEILADEYVGGENSHNKREYIDKLTPDSSVRSWELLNLDATRDGKRATMRGTLREERPNGTEVYEFTDKFVWRDHRWQAVSSVTTRVE